ncbi:DUF4179 domain-containing protein [Cohnella candidum]|uniref:DUF4179 domain-containing protein n=1 Tax=Cohnella candidum TaxID=2674991 RepID=A0A3G3JZH6_9BACL|nr:DUF4179 domain-containing protein [Cohnella candidum]AYQ73277.1 DUF4179 domain-containing protein [Cohnella candidum]
MSYIDPEIALRRQSTNQSETLPSLVALRIEQTLQALPDSKTMQRRKALRKWTLSAASVCIVLGGLFAFVAGAGSDVQSELRSIPVVGSLIPDSKTKPLQQASDQGIDFQIMDVIYDGHVLRIDYEIDSDRDLSGKNLEVNMKIDGVAIEKIVHDKGGNQPPVIVDGEQVTSRRSRGILTTSFAAYRPSSFRMDLEVTRIGSQDGKWVISRNIAKTDRIIVIESGKRVENGLFSLELGRFALSPLTSEFSYKMTPKDPDMDQMMVGFDVVGDKGQIYSYNSETVGGGLPASSGFRSDMFSPLRSGTRYLTIRPFHYVYGDSGLPDPNAISRVPMDGIPSEREPIVLPQGKAGRVFVTKIEYFEDQTVIHFKTEGSNPNQQSQYFWVERENGTMPDILGRPVPNIHQEEQMLVIAPVPADAKLVFATAPVVPITYDPDMQFRLEIPR